MWFHVYTIGVATAQVNLTVKLTVGLYRVPDAPMHTAFLKTLQNIGLEPAFRDADSVTDIPAKIITRTSACRSACLRNNVSDVSARILARMSVSVSASWNAGLSRSRRAAPRRCRL